MSGLNSAPSAERIHIGFFGVRNAGKSSLVNAVCGQEVAVVSDTLLSALSHAATDNSIKKANITTILFFILTHSLPLYAFHSSIK